jgi:phage gp16-like protein
VLDHLKRLVNKRPTPAEPVAAMSAKIRALLRSAGRPDAYADSIARRMYRVHFWEWLRPDQMHALVAALRIDEKRRQRTANSRGDRIPADVAR